LDLFHDLALPYDGGEWPILACIGIITDIIRRRRPAGVQPCSDGVQRCDSWDNTSCLGRCSTVSLEELHGALVLFCLFQRRKRAEIPALAGLAVDLS
jgi:hypothetical protein